VDLHPLAVVLDLRVDVPLAQLVQRFLPALHRLSEHRSDHGHPSAAAAAAAVLVLAAAVAPGRAPPVRADMAGHEAAQVVVHLVKEGRALKL
jgi:hypothetical protein